MVRNETKYEVSLNVHAGFHLAHQELFCHFTISKNKLQQNYGLVVTFGVRDFQVVQLKTKL